MTGEKYMYEKWRGPALADFLIDLRRKSTICLFLIPVKVFSLKDYVYKLIREINLYNKDIKDEIKDIEVFWKKILCPLMKNCLWHFVTAIIIR